MQGALRRAAALSNSNCRTRLSEWSHNRLGFDAPHYDQKISQELISSQRIRSLNHVHIWQSFQGHYVSDTILKIIDMGFAYVSHIKQVCDKLIMTIQKLWRVPLSLRRLHRRRLSSRDGVDRGRHPTTDVPPKAWTKRAHNPCTGAPSGSRMSY